VVSDFQAFEPEAGNSQNMDVVMAISPQSAVDNIVNILKKAGRKAAAIDVEPLGIARSLRYSYETDLLDKSVCVVEIGHKTTAINIYKNGKLLMPRQVPIGGEMFTREIANALTMPFADAERMKHDKGSVPESASAQGFNPFGAPAAATQQFTPYNPFADPDEQAAAAPEPPVAPEPEPAPLPVSTDDSESVRIFNAMAGVVDEFVAEVRRSIDYFRSKGGEVNTIMVCGGGAKLKGLTTFLGKALGLPCEIYDPMKGISVSARKMDGALANDRKEDFVVAVGNCLHIYF